MKYSGFSKIVLIGQEINQNFTTFWKKLPQNIPLRSLNNSIQPCQLSADICHCIKILGKEYVRFRSDGVPDRLPPYHEVR